METLDADGNGELSPEEIQNAVTALLSLDSDGDGAVSQEEMIPQPIKEEDGFVARIMANDHDGDGRVSEEELPTQMRSLMTRADFNEDGYIEPEEIEEMVANRRSKSKSETKLSVGETESKE